MTTFAAGILQWIKRIDTAYDGQGNPYLITSYGDTSGTTVRNQVQRAYNGLGQMIAEYQAHSGAVNTGSSPKVQYAYSEMASGANHSRPVSMTYPNGRVIDFNYGVALDDSIGRLSALKDGSTTLESYDYLGLGTVVKRGHAQSGVDLTYIKASGEGNGDAGDQYTGLDRFGRVVDQRWRTSSVEKDRYQYTYDRNGNRLTKSNALNSNLNESYTYDSLNQLSAFSTTGTTKSWDYDALGNWDGVTTNGSTQTRTHNRQNEITAISGATTPTFDANGNMTKDETGRVFYYDAWNRLQQVNDPTNSFALVVQVHDGLGRRVTETASTFGIDLYYSAGWQVVEERNYNAVTKSYVWSPVYVDAMVARDRDTDANGSLDERLYVMHDANFNVTGLVNTSGTVVERYTYDPYGVATVRDGSWTAGSTAYVWQYLHQGGRLSGQSGLYSFRYREYSPTLGRWVTMDPIKYYGNDANLYRYIASNPLKNIDPIGLDDRTYDPKDFWNIHILPNLPRGQGDFWWSRYKMGCVGLCSVRLSSVKYPHLLPGTRCFTDLNVAIATRDAMKSTNKCSGKCYVFAVQFHKYRNEDPHPRTYKEPTEINPTSINIDEFNFATCWDEDTDIIYWEFMNHTLDKEGAVVIHSNTLPGPSRYPITVYCAACARSKTDPSLVREINGKLEDVPVLRDGELIPPITK